MGRKSAHSGMSPKDRSINLMDKFITKNANRAKDKPVLPGRRKDKDIPLNLWPLKDQIEYWENRTDADRFDEDYSAYSTWYDEVKRKSGVYPQTFLDFTAKLKTEMRTMWENKMVPRAALMELRKLGVY
jgi:hypothetical protein